MRKICYLVLPYFEVLGVLELWQNTVNTKGFWPTPDFDKNGQRFFCGEFKISFWWKHVIQKLKKTPKMIPPHLPCLTREKGKGKFEISSNANQALAHGWLHLPILKTEHFMEGEKVCPASRGFLRGPACRPLCFEWAIAISWSLEVFFAHMHRM